MLQKIKKFKVEKINHYLNHQSILIFQLGNTILKSWLKIKKLFSTYGLEPLKIKNTIFNKFFANKNNIGNFSQSSVIIVKNKTSNIYKNLINKVNKKQTNLILLGVKEKNYYYLSNKVNKIFTTLKTNTVEENLNLNLINLNKKFYIYLKIKSTKKTK